MAPGALSPHLLWGASRVGPHASILAYRIKTRKLETFTYFFFCSFFFKRDERKEARLKERKTIDTVLDYEAAKQHKNAYEKFHSTRQ